MLKHLYVGIMLLVTMVASGAQFAQPAYAACPPDTLLGIPAWYRGLQDTTTCAVKMPETNGKVDIQKFIMSLALNIIQAGLALVAYITIFFIIKGGFGYMTSAGSSDGMASAKKTITNAIIGLVIAVFAASIVNAIAGFIN
jgi:hypothetical protein